MGQSGGRRAGGDPYAAMLEVLDPDQNHSFMDHYMGVPIDLSQVVFIATANYIEGIAGPLLDRMEVIPLAGYTVEEKLMIAKKYLVPRQISAAYLSGNDITFLKSALHEIITGHTREAGVRELERSIGSVCRHSKS